MAKTVSKDVTCPTCGAPAGQPCRGSAYSGRGARTVQSHHKRVEAARRVDGDVVDGQ